MSNHIKSYLGIAGIVLALSMSGCRMHAVIPGVKDSNNSKPLNEAQLRAENDAMKTMNGYQIDKNYGPNEHKYERSGNIVGGKVEF